MKKVAMIVLFPLTFLACKPEHPAILPTPVISAYNKLISNQSDFIMALQLDDGALTMSANKGVPGYKIVPYFSNIAARALLSDPTAAHIAAVKKWMVWYMGHLNADGSVFDYYATNFTGTATLTSTGDFDSVDSYAATFLTLARLLCEVSPADKDWLATNYSAQLKKIGNAIILVIESDGLTIAKPSYAVKYTMDNAEVNEGMKDMVWLCKNVITAGEIEKWQTLLTNNTNAINAVLWNAASNNYFMYAGGATINWSVFYADATCQLYPTWCGVVTPSSATAISLWNTFNTNYPDWSTGKIYDAGGYPWAVIGYVAAVMNDRVRTEQYLKYIGSFTATGVQPTANWYNLEAAFVILAAKKMN